MRDHVYVGHYPLMEFSGERPHVTGNGNIGSFLTFLRL